MATRRINEFLVGSKIPHSTIIHPYAATASEAAESSLIPSRLMAKVVVVWLGGDLALVVVPANKSVDLEKLRQETKTHDARLAEPGDFHDHFSDCQVGTVPPFGNLFGVDTYLDRQLTGAQQFAFSAGTHQDVMVISYMDYDRLVKPHVLDVAREPSEEEVLVESRRARSRARRSAGRTQFRDAMPEPEWAIQADCGCTIAHHQGAD